MILQCGYQVKVTVIAEDNKEYDTPYLDVWIQSKSESTHCPDASSHKVTRRLKSSRYRDAVLVDGSDSVLH